MDSQGCRQKSPQPSPANQTLKIENTVDLSQNGQQLLLQVSRPSAHEDNGPTVVNHTLRVSPQPRGCYDAFAIARAGCSSGRVAAPLQKALPGRGRLLWGEPKGGRAKGGPLA